MTPLDLILLLIVALFVVCLVIVAASEPRTTWRNYMTLDDKLAELQANVDELSRKIGEQLIPAFERATNAILEFSDVMNRINHDQP